MMLKTDLHAIGIIDSFIQSEFPCEIDVTTFSP
jgi:hypothetical protein